MTILESEFIFAVEKSIIKYFKAQVPTINVNGKSKMVNIFADYPRMFKDKHRPSACFEIVRHTYESYVLGNHIGTQGASGGLVTDQWGYKVPFTLSIHTLTGSAMERRILDGAIDFLLIKMADGRGSIPVCEFATDLDSEGNDSGMRISVSRYSAISSVPSEDIEKEDYMSIKSIEMESFYITLADSYPVSGFNWTNNIQV